MTGDDLIALAGSLAASTGLGGAEARYRSAVSRAYYGAYHLAVALLAECGASIRTSAYGHNDVYVCLWESGYDPARQAARHLSQLRTERNRADYRLDDYRFRVPANAMQAVEMAYDVKRCLEACRNDPAALDAIQRGIEAWRNRAGR